MDILITRNVSKQANSKKGTELGAKVPFIFIRKIHESINICFFFTGTNPYPTNTLSTIGGPCPWDFNDKTCAICATGILKIKNMGGENFSSLIGRKLKYNFILILD